MYPFIHPLDGFDTLSAQPNSPNDVITSKSQIIMMIFAVRSIGKCTNPLMQMPWFLSTLRLYCWRWPADHNDKWWCFFVYVPRLILSFKSRKLSLVEFSSGSFSSATIRIHVIKLFRRLARRWNPVKLGGFGGWFFFEFWVVMGWSNRWWDDLGVWI